MWDERMVVASGKGHRGPWQMNASEWYFVDDPTVGINQQGEIGVAWVDQDRHDIFFQVYEPDARPRFDEPVNISRSPNTFSWLPRLVMDSDEPDEVFVLWQEIIFSGGTHGGEIFFARSDDGGKHFSTPQNLSNTVAGAGKGRLREQIWYNGSLDLAGGAEGDLYAAWTVYEGGLFFSRSVDGGNSFQEPLKIAGAKGDLPARGPSLAVFQQEIRLVWAVGEDKEGDLHFSMSGDAGKTFSPPQTLFATDGYSEAPKITADSNGTFHLVFAESPMGPLQQYHVRYSRSTGETGGFTEPETISDGHSRKFASVGFPYLDLDGQGTLFVMWEIFPEGGIRPESLGFTFSQDGKSFAPPMVVPGTLDPEQGFNGSQQGLYMAKLAAGPSGELAVVNSTFKPKESSRIWLIRGLTQHPSSR